MINLRKNKQKVYEGLVKISRNNIYTIGNGLDYSYHQNYYKFIGTDLSRQTNITIPQQTNFIGKLEENIARTFFIAEK